MVLIILGTENEIRLSNFKSNMEEYKMKTITYKISKEIQIPILFALFSMAIITTFRVRELQINEKLTEITVIASQIEHEMPRRRRLDCPELFSFRSKREGISPVEISNKFIPGLSKTEAIMFNEPAHPTESLHINT
jgi:hypothetical protein